MDITGYFRYVLGTSGMKRIEIEKSFRACRPTSDDSPAEGCVNLEKGLAYEKLFGQLAKGLGDKGARRARQQGLEVLVISRVLRAEHGKPQALLVMPALLDESGRLSCGADFDRVFPWIPRDFLNEADDSAAHSPRHAKETAVFLGTMRSYLQFVRSVDAGAMRLAKDALPEEKLWARYLSFSEHLYQSVVTVGAGELEESGISIDDSSVFIGINDSVNASQAIEELYGEIGRTSRDSIALYGSMVSLEPRQQVPARSNEGVLASMLAHAGTMGREFPLAKRQRLAVWKRAELKGGQVLAVSGPPGTGKTTLLQGIVADLMVSHALAGNSAPVIVGASTNNQAVTNIITSFGEVAQDEGVSVYRRWLPDVDLLEGSIDSDKPLRSFGAYSPAAGKKLGEALRSGLLVTDVSKLGDERYLYGMCSGYEYEDAAKELFLGQARAYLGVPTKSVAELRRATHKLLTRVDDLRRRLIELVFAEAPASERTVVLDELNRYAALPEGRRLTDDDCASPARLDEALDTKVRPLEFWLAVHYFEARWLTCEYLTGKELRSSAREARETYRSQLANITPLQVMTLYRLPRQMSYSERIGANQFVSHFDFAAIDLLIIDEAGQVDASVGAAAFALAKQAVVVGDVSQLPPVWGIAEDADVVMAREFAAAGDSWEQTWEVMRERGLTASEPSSLMAAAQAACPWSHEYEDEGGELRVEGGLFLSEHRRCLDTIINYCNRLIYHGQLEPKRGDTPGAETGLPAMGFCAVEGKAQPSGTSRKNVLEAKAVVDWIRANFEHIYQAFDDANAASEEKKRAKNPGLVIEHKAPDPQKLVAVVTPFGAQAGEIKRLLGKLGALTIAGESHRWADLVTVGTAHSLQGAERPVVLFSLVYDASSSAGFVQDNPNLMNVAVSRAKDSFIVFGSRQLLKSQGRGRGVLALLKLMCLGNEVELPEDPAPVPAPAKEAKRTAGQKRPPKESHAKKPSPAEGAVPATKMIEKWEGRGMVKKGELKAADLNQLLKRVGIIRKVDGSWRPTEEGEELGVVLLEGKGYVYPGYPPAVWDKVFGLAFGG